MPPRKPLYIVIEGLDGCGKDAQADLIAQYLVQRNRPIPLRLNEPDRELPTGYLLRELLRTGEYSEAHAALFLADRLVIQTRKVVPALTEGRDVISSRSFISTLVYQQDRWPLSWLMGLHAHLPVKPDIVILIDLDPEIALQRLQERGGHFDCYERLDVLQTNRSRYLDLTMDSLTSFIAVDGTILVVSGNGSEEEVFNRILDELEQELC